MEIISLLFSCFQVLYSMLLSSKYLVQDLKILAKDLGDFIWICLKFIIIRQDLMSMLKIYSNFIDRF